MALRSGPPRGETRRLHQARRHRLATSLSRPPPPHAPCLRPRRWCSVRAMPSSTSASPIPICCRWTRSSRAPAAAHRDIRHGRCWPTARPRARGRSSDGFATASKHARASPVSLDECLGTAGNSDAIDQVCTLFTRPGDIAFVESPTYHLGLRILRDHDLDLRPIPTDRDGLRVDVLAEQLRQLASSGRTARLLYTIPTFHNPTGVNLSTARRRALVDLAVEHGFVDPGRRRLSGAVVRRRGTSGAVRDRPARHRDPHGLVREVTGAGAQARLDQLQPRPGATARGWRTPRQRRRAELHRRDGGGRVVPRRRLRRARRAPARRLSGAAGCPGRGTEAGPAFGRLLRPAGRRLFHLGHAAITFRHRNAAGAGRLATRCRSSPEPGSRPMAPTATRCGCRSR